MSPGWSSFPRFHHPPSLPGEPVRAWGALGTFRVVAQKAAERDFLRFLDAIGNQYGRHGAAQRNARQLKRRLENASIKEIFQNGLHEFVESFVTDNNRLGKEITEQYLIG